MLTTTPADCAATIWGGVTQLAADAWCGDASIAGPDAQGCAPARTWTAGDSVIPPMGAALKRPYLRENRLADVLALIQVLALDEYPYRSDGGLTDELQGAPASAPSWREVALEHPEFFRVSKKEDSRLSLTARHVMPKAEEKQRQPLPADFTHQLLRTALELHDRQREAASWWRPFVPLIAAVLTGVLTFGGGYYLGQQSARQNPPAPIVQQPAAKP
jgi:hypothetical protein